MDFTSWWESGKGWGSGKGWERLCGPWKHDLLTTQLKSYQNRQRNKRRIYRETRGHGVSQRTQARK